MTRLIVGFIVLCIICAIAIAWTMNAIHSICEAIQAILDIMHSRDKIENLACQRVVELQADKGRLTDELSEAKEIIHKVCYEFGVYNKDLMEKARQFLKEPL